MSSEFEYSKKLMALARRKHTETRSKSRNHSESGRKSSFRKRMKRIRRANRGEIVKRPWGKSSDERNKGLGKKQWIQDLKGEAFKAQNVGVEDTPDVLKESRRSYEFSERLVALSRKKDTFSRPHAHCCKCVQSFECFWPISNLQTIRLQSLV